MTRTEAIEQSRGPLAMTEANYRKVVAREKTQTRRILNGAVCTDKDAYRDDKSITWYGGYGVRDWNVPKYQPGEIYYLPEPVQLVKFSEHAAFCTMKYLWTGTFTKRWISDEITDKVIARKRGWNAPTTARFMLKAFAREFVRIKSVKVERVRDITPEDAIAEGCDPSEGALGNDIIDFDLDMNLQFKTDDHGKAYVVRPPARPIRRFKHLWNSIHGANAWNANPWVWAYEFERLEATNG